VHGDATRKDELFGWTNGPPDYRTTERASYDEYGRRLEATTSTTPRPQVAYTLRDRRPADGRPRRPTALNQVTTSTSSRRWARRPLSVDPAGVAPTPPTIRWAARHRLAARTATRRRRPQRTRSLPGPYRRTRTRSPDKVLQADGSYTATYNLLRRHGRARQTQTPASGGGRVIVDTSTNARAWKVKETAGRTTDRRRARTGRAEPRDGHRYARDRTSYDGAGDPPRRSSRSKASNSGGHNEHLRRLPARPLDPPARPDADHGRSPIRGATCVDCANTMATRRPVIHKSDLHATPAQTSWSRHRPGRQTYGAKASTTCGSTVLPEAVVGVRGRHCSTPLTEDRTLVGRPAPS